MMFFPLVTVILQPYQEIVGRLHNIVEDGDRIICLFNFFDVIEIPKEALIVDDLKPFKGSRIGIINLGNEGYRVRKIILKNGGNENDKKIARAKKN